MIATVYQTLAGLGLLSAISLPLAMATFPRWEPALHRWLERRRRQREERPYRFGKRVSR